MGYPHVGILKPCQKKRCQEHFLPFTFPYPIRLKPKQKVDIYFINFKYSFPWKYVLSSFVLDFMFKRFLKFSRYLLLSKRMLLSYKCSFLYTKYVFSLVLGGQCLSIILELKPSFCNCTTVVKNGVLTSQDTMILNQYWLDQRKMVGITEFMTKCISTQ